MFSASPTPSGAETENFPWACEMRVGDPDGHVLRFGSDPKSAE
jgi:hypothetical protein